MTAEQTVYIVDDSKSVVKALSAVAKSAGFAVETFESGEDFLKILNGNECGCVLLDFRLQGMSGLQLLKQLKSRSPGLEVIIVTGHADISAAVECMKQGAMDFLEKPVDHHTLLAKIEEALALSESAQLSRAQVLLGQKRVTALTAREREILRLLVAGKSSKQIAVETRLSLKTVSNHRAHLLAKTGAENTADLVRIALVSRIVDPQSTSDSTKIKPNIRQANRHRRRPDH